jgi:hypothetical protein
METLSATVHIKQETQPFEDISGDFLLFSGLHFFDRQFVFD